MSKFKKKKDGGLPPVNTASLPDIVFMLLFFFMVATVMREDTLKIKNALPLANSSTTLFAESPICTLESVVEPAKVPTTNVSSDSSKINAAASVSWALSK